MPDEKPSPPGKGGRPKKFTPEVERRFLQVIRAGERLQVACMACGISDETLARHRKESEEFDEALERAGAEASIAKVLAITRAAEAGDWRAAAWWLERRYPDQWGRRDRMDVTTGGKAIGAVRIIELPDNHRGDRYVGEQPPVVPEVLEEWPDNDRQDRYIPE